MSIFILCNNIARLVNGALQRWIDANSSNHTIEFDQVAPLEQPLDVAPRTAASEPDWTAALILAGSRRRSLTSCADAIRFDIPHTLNYADTATNQAYCGEDE